MKISGDQILYSVLGGSHLYGLNTPESDIDIITIYTPKAKDILGLTRKDYIDESTKKSDDSRRNTNEDQDKAFHSITRFFELVLKGSPNIFEILFAPSNAIINTTDFFENTIKANYRRLLSSKLHDSFIGYAIRQKNKLTNKSQRFFELKRALEYLDSNILVLDNKMSQSMAEDLNRILHLYKGSKNNVESFHVGLPVDIIYSKIKEEYENYGWRVKTKDFEKLHFDKKFAAHAIRLLVEGEQLLKEGNLSFPLKGEGYIDIMKIKSGIVQLEEFYDLFQKWDEKCAVARIYSCLPKKVDLEWINELLVDFLHTKLYNEYLLKEQIV